MLQIVNIEATLESNKTDQEKCLAEIDALKVRKF